MSRRTTVALAAAVTLLACLATARRRSAALPGWSILPDPLAAATSLDAVGTFGDTGLVVAGAGAAVAVSGDGGATWTDISASVLTSVTLSGVAFTDAEHGVAVGPAGTDPRRGARRPGGVRLGDGDAARRRDRRPA